MAGIKKVILDLKIYYKLHFVYPKSAKFKNIRSIFSNTIEVGNDVSIEENVDISGHLKKLEDGLYLGKRTYIGSCEHIGKYTSISYDVKVGLVAHPLNFISSSPVFYAKRRGWLENNLFNENQAGLVHIGHDVLISANVIIKAGVKIGTGAVIGAGAFVNKDVPPYSIVAGVPAKVIRYRFSEEEIKQLLESKWWERSKEELLQLKTHFNSPGTFLENLSRIKK
jgi:acetyltransferase-like isoleucine patch superfamily enzyme